MPRLLRGLCGRRSWQGHIGWYIGGLLKKIVFSDNVLPSAAPPLLPLFQGTESNTPLTASVEATDLQEVTCASVSKPCARPVPAGARPMCRTSTSPPSPSRILDPNCAPPPANPATCPVSFLGLLGPKDPVVGVFVRAREPEPCFRHPPLVAREFTPVCHGWKLF